MEQSPNTRGPSGAQHQPYSAQERELIVALARRSTTQEELRALFPGRTLAAVKSRIVAERHRLGSVQRQSAGASGKVTMLEPDDEGFDDGWERKNRHSMTQASCAFLSALRAA